MARMQLILTAAVLLTASLSPDHARADDREIAQQIANVMKATGYTRHRRLRNPLNSMYL